MARKDRPTAFLLDAAAFLSDDKVLIMAPAEVGAYIRLLCAAYLRTPPASIPVDDPTIARLAGMTPDEWTAAKPKVIACWRRQGDVYVQPRLQESYELAVTGKRKRSERAAKAANARWNAPSIHQAIPTRTSESTSSGIPPSSSGESEGGDCAQAARDAERMRPSARVRIQRAYGRIKPNGGIRANGVRDAVAEAVRRATTEEDGWGQGMPLHEALDELARRVEVFSDSALARSTPRDYLPDLSGWLAKHALDDPEAWEVARGNGQQDPMASAKRTLEAL